MRPYHQSAQALTARAYPYQLPPDIDLYNAAAAQHELVIEKYCRTLGTTLAGIVNYDDRVAVSYLMSRTDVAPERVGCVGLSGGGMRSTLLQATTPQIAAAVIVGAMSTYEELLDHNIRTHTWMFFPRDWALIGDWPDAAACRAPSPLMVQYDMDDPLYTIKGQKDAHRRIASHYRSKNKPGNYDGRFYPGPHKFDAEMQGDAFAFLRKWLADKAG
jgi:dienelactone hydrolase